MSRKKKALAAGHICIDITPVFPQKNGKKLTDMFVPGKTVHMNGMNIHTGGAVANTGLAMKLLGNDISLRGKVGDDALGRLILDMLADYGVEEGMLVSPEEHTSYSIVLAPPGTDRIFFHDPGANNSFTTKDLDMAAVRQADLLHFGYPSVMRSMYERGGAELTLLMKTVHDADCAVSLDMSAIDPQSESGKEDWHGILERTVPYVDFFVPSAEELCFMLDRRRYDDWMMRAAGRDVIEVLTLADIRPLADALLAMGAKVVLIKCGAPGLYYKTADISTMHPLCGKQGLDPAEWAGKEGFEPGFKPGLVCSATGAGDASIAAFLTYVLEGRPLSEAVRIASAEGACCVEAYDALSGLRPLPELEDRIRRGWERTIPLPPDEK